MMTQLAFALKDIWRKPIVFVFFAIQLTVPIFFCCLSLIQVVDSVQYIRHVNQVSDYKVVFFSPQIGTMRQWRISQGAKELLVATLDEARRGYSVVETVKLRDYPNLNIVIGLGAFVEVFQLRNDSKESSKPLVLIGHDVDALQVGSTVEFGRRNTTDLTVSSRLPQGASYVMPGGLKSLDKSLIILTEAESMMDYFFNDWEYGVQIVTNTCLISPTGTEMSEFVTRMRNETGMALNPIDLGAYAEQHYQGNFYGVLYLLVFFGITMVYVVVGIVTNTIQLLDSRMTEYAIHLLSGARMWHLCSRIVIYLLLLVSLPILAVSWLLFLMFRIPLPRLIGVVPPLVLFVILLASFPLVRLYNTDIVSHLRSDD
ncbi:MAG: hypothetical protein FD169_3 [Bacillota bacterium]|nr:MAG: hypothetical protein FD169_3 [Bacillota bacterium]